MAIFDTVLIANRGEIAVRIIRTLRSMGIRSIAVYSDADVDARHVAEADLAVRLGPETPSESYLHTDRVLEAARASGAQAVHPGYGFLSENAGFARAVTAAGLVFIGPPADAIELMGDKIRAKTVVAAAGVPVVPGLAEPGLSDADLAEAATSIGFPVLLKPSAGGGGKGMRLVHRPEDLLAEAAAGRREAAGAFGDDTLFIERFVSRPRHLEVQVLGDANGAMVHLGERECSLQRRHQKIIEEAPSPLLTDRQRAGMAEQALAAARACGYVNAGTVEFIVSADQPDECFFMEMNTRLQVEHPVTEMVWGVDLVELQVRVAAGEPLPFEQSDLSPSGHAVEARVYAEDPSAGFLPSSGSILALHEPRSTGVRVDSSLSVGTEIGTSYDPMLAKIIASGSDRATALARLDDALRATTVLGVRTNLSFLRGLLRHPDVVAGRLDTELVERVVGDLVTSDVPDEVVAAGALTRLLTSVPAGDPSTPWDLIGGWRIGEAAWTTWNARCVPLDVSAAVRRAGRTADEFEIRDADGDISRWEVTLVEQGLVLASGNQVLRFAVACRGDATWVGLDGRAWELSEADRSHLGPESIATRGGAIVSPMPGTVTAVLAVLGAHVEQHQPVLVVEAMKMEHTLTAPVSGRLTTCSVEVGDKVDRSQVVAVVDADETTLGSPPPS